MKLPSEFLPTILAKHYFPVNIQIHKRRVTSKNFRRPSRKNFTRKKVSAGIFSCTGNFSLSTNEGELNFLRYLICYDIPDDKTRDAVVNYLERFAWRVQYSVFSCRLDEAQALLTWKDLLAIAPPSEGNSVLMLPLCKACEKNLQFSNKPLEEEKGFLVV